MTGHDPDFSQSKIPAPIQERILEIAGNQNDEMIVYRLVSNSDPRSELLKEDFLPSFLQKPTPAKKDGIGFYGMSVFDDKDVIRNLRNTVKPLRKNKPSIACGKINSRKELSDGPENHHCNCYLFDPDNKNPVDDFTLDEVGNDKMTL